VEEEVDKSQQSVESDNAELDSENSAESAESKGDEDS